MTSGASITRGYVGDNCDYQYPNGTPKKQTGELRNPSAPLKWRPNRLESALQLGSYGFDISPRRLGFGGTSPNIDTTFSAFIDIDEIRCYRPVSLAETVSCICRMGLDSRKRYPAPLFTSILASQIGTSNALSALQALRAQTTDWIEFTNGYVVFPAKISAADFIKRLCVQSSKCN